MSARLRRSLVRVHFFTVFWLVQAVEHKSLPGRMPDTGQTANNRDDHTRASSDSAIADEADPTPPRQHPYAVKKAAVKPLVLDRGMLRKTWTSDDQTAWLKTRTLKRTGKLLNEGRVRHTAKCKKHALSASIMEYQCVQKVNQFSISGCELFSNDQT